MTIIISKFASKQKKSYLCNANRLRFLIVLIPGASVRTHLFFFILLLDDSFSDSHTRQALVTSVKSRALAHTPANSRALALTPVYSCLLPSKNTYNYFCSVTYYIYVYMPSKMGKYKSVPLRLSQRNIFLHFKW